MLYPAELIPRFLFSRSRFACPVDPSDIIGMLYPAELIPRFRFTDVPIY